MAKKLKESVKKLKDLVKKKLKVMRPCRASWASKKCTKNKPDKHFTLLRHDH